MIEVLTGATEEVAFYDYSEKIVLIPLTFITVLSTVMMPRIANEFKKGHETTVSELLNNAAKFSVFLAFPMTFGMISVADKLVPWYLGSEFEPTIYAIMLISPIVISNTLSGISGSQYFTATNQIAILVKSQFLAAAANIVINAMLIPNYGFYGAAIATLITSFLCAIVQYSYMLKQIKMPGLIKELVKYLLVSILMFGVIRALTGKWEATPITNILQILIGGTTYIGVCILLKDSQLKLVFERIKKLLSK